jgi:DNA polymerase (family 10)
MEEVVDKKGLANQLKEAANLLEVLGEDGFRARAFQNASRQLEGFEGDFSALYLAGRLTEIRGVGAGLAAELSQPLDDDGLLPLLADLRERVPEGVRDLFRVSGLGAKKVAALWREGIEGLESLIAAVDDGSVAALKGFGAKSAEKFRAGALFAFDAMRRWRADEADLLASELHQRLGSSLPDAQIAVVGEVRRACNTVAAIELLAAGVEGAEAERALGELIGSVAEETPDRFGGLLGGRRVALHLCRPEAFGAALAWHSGSEPFRSGLQASAEALGMTLGPDGLRRDDAPLATPEERDLFALLDRPVIEPELREQAEPMAVPDLVTLADIRGLVHNHTVWSDAVHTVREMVAGARERGAAYLALADHSLSSYVANGLSPERVVAQAHEVAEVRAELAAEGSDFDLLHGIEVDIRSDGGLDYDYDILALLDYTVVSVHQNFTLSEAKQTERVVRAVHHPRAHILGHASGRLLLRRPPYAVDLQAVIEACAETGTAIEINASPYRLDLDWRWVRKAKELGCRFAINPDAHRIEGYDVLPFGVRAARKGGLTAADVVNTAPTGSAFLARLKGS